MKRLICAIRGHRDQWPKTQDGKTTVTCGFCERTSVGVSFGDGVTPPRRLEDRPGSNVVVPFTVTRRS